MITISFVILIASNGLYKHFPNLDEIRLRWSFRKGWIKWEKEDAPVVCAQTHDQMCEKIATWMREERPYIYTQFSMSDILKQFPELNGRTLVETFARRNYTFQSYVREVRINEAIRIMDESIVPLRFNEVYHKVGFSHYSSFSRAFTAVKGLSPSNYTSNR